MNESINLWNRCFSIKKIQDIANSYRMRYDPQYSKIPPHITLKESFTADQQTIDKLTEDLSKIAKETEPFDIEIKRLVPSALLLTRFI